MFSATRFDEAQDRLVDAWHTEHGAQSCQQQHSSPWSRTDDGAPLRSAREGCWIPRRFDTAVFVIVDAMRYDFAAPDAPLDEHTKAFRGHLPVIGEYLQNEASNSRLMRFVADGPTTTLQRLEGMTTGSLPTFIKVASNFNSGAFPPPPLYMYPGCP